MRSPGQVDLVIDSREGGDWSLDLLFAGLVHNLGPENVIGWPYRFKHHEWDDPRVGHGTEHHNWNLERRTLGYTPLNRFVYGARPGQASDLASGGHIRGLLGVNRLRRIWLDERPESFQLLKELGPMLNDVPVVVVAGHDRFWNHSPQFVASLYGKRLEAMLLDNWYHQYQFLPFRVRRIGWSTNFDHYWTRPEVAPEKDIDISFVGYNSHPDRARYIDHIEREWPQLRKHIVLERRPDTIGQFVPKAQYFDVIQRSRICLNLRGAADRGKTMRAYEIPYVGSFMLSQTIEDPKVSEDFRPDVDCVYFDDEDHLDSCIAQYLGIKGGDGAEDRERVAAAGHARAIGPLSVKSRWADVLGWLGDL